MSKLLASKENADNFTLGMTVLLHDIDDSTHNTLEGLIVQDTDRLYAICAIGVARTFPYGGSENRMMYDPNIKSIEFKSLEDVKNENNHTINYFYEKLVKSKFLDEFYYEWNFASNLYIMNFDIVFGKY